MTIKLSVVVPCYNVPNILKNILIIIKEVSSITDDYEIIIVDDGSDEFPYIKQNDYVKVITNEKNQGKGYSLKRGFALACGNIICFIDGDLQIPAITLASYYEIINGRRSPDILIGSKRHANSKIHYPFIRRFYSFGFQTMNRYLFGLNVLDTQSGIKFFKRDIIKELLPYLCIDGFAIDLEILSLAQRKGYKIIEGPIKIQKSFGSTVNIKAVFRMLKDSIKIWLRYKYRRR